MTSLSLSVNSARHELEVEPSTLLSDLLTEALGLRGTHIGCDTAQCGACTVLVDGDAVKSCNVLALQVNGADVTTIEGLQGPDGSLHPMQTAFAQQRGLQCGYCTPGMVMRCIALHREGVGRNERAIASALSGNLCRCTGYRGIVQAALKVLESIDRAGPPP